MSDVSGNDVLEESNDSEESNDIQEDIDESNEIESEISVYQSIDYTSYFENLQNVSFIILTVLIAIGIVIAFINGFGKNG